MFANLRDRARIDQLLRIGDHFLRAVLDDAPSHQSAILDAAVALLNGDGGYLPRGMASGPNHPPLKSERPSLRGRKAPRGRARASASHRLRSAARVLLLARAVALRPAFQSSWPARRPVRLNPMSVAARPLFALDNSYVRELGGLYEPWQAAPAPAPRLLVLNGELATELGVDADALGAPDGVAVLAGNAMPEGSSPVAQAYAGHQFGGFSPRLGDGRALLVGEVLDLSLIHISEPTRPY